MKGLRLYVLLIVTTTAIGCPGKPGEDSGIDFDTGSDDSEAPMITLNGDDPMFVEVNETFTDPGATVTDNVDMDLTAAVSGTVDTSSLGDYTLTYYAVDSAGNAAESVTRTVTVQDTTPPVITLNGDDPMLVEEGSTFTDPGATVSDNYDTDLSVTVTGAVDSAISGVYTLTYDAVDSSGNVASTVTRTVEVVFSGHLFVAANGADLSLVGLSPDGVLAERDVFYLSDWLEGYNDTQVIFSIAQDPISKDIYVSSFNHCGGGAWLSNDGCWGNARIDRFTYDVNTLTYEGIAYVMQHSLRALPPTYDSTSGEMTFTFLNQGVEDLGFITITATTLPKLASMSSACDGVTLKHNDTCDVVISTTSADDSFSFSVDTSEGGYSYSSEYYDDISRQLVRTDGDWPSREDLPSCVDYSWGYPNQYGSCTPTALTISADGSRAYINEDCNDHALVMDINSDGTFTFVSEGESNIWYQGIAVNNDGTMLYNGVNNFALSSDGIVSKVSSDYDNGGNATEVLEYDGDEVLVSTISNTYLGIYSLTDPTVPTAISEATPSVTSYGGALFQHHNADLSTIALVGYGSLSIFDFNGTELTELSSEETEHEIDCKNCSFDVYNRGVQVTPDGSHAVTSTFVNFYDEETMLKLPYEGILTAYSIDATTGQLEEISGLEMSGKSRTVLLLQP